MSSFLTSAFRSNFLLHFYEWKLQLTGGLENKVFNLSDRLLDSRICVFLFLFYKKH